MITVVVAFAVMLGLAWPLGTWLSRALAGERTLVSRITGPLERALFRLAGIDPSTEMTWTAYAAALLAFNLAGLLVVHLFERLQHVLPLNPAGLGAVDPAVAFNTAVSFATNTNWQAYGGETTMSHFTQMAALTTQNFVSAATGLAVMAALARGFSRKETATIGNFWADLVRSTFQVLLPLSIVLALLLVQQGVPQTLAGNVDGTGLGDDAAIQKISLGPVASQVAIKQLGTNGGGFYNVNSAHPLENPTPWTNLLEWWSILLLPAACVFAFGRMVGDARQGRALLAAVSVVFLAAAWVTVRSETAGNPLLARAGADQSISASQSGGNMEGKEARFGPVDSAAWAVATTAASNGSVNAMHDSFTPLGALGPMFLMQLGEVVFGGVGSGLYGLVLYVIVAVFVSGLLVGRTPEYLGKKLGAFEMQMATLAILLPSAAVLLGTAIACLVPEGTAALGNPGIHGFSEILYAFSSGANNNGSAFGGLTVSGPFYAGAIGLCMLVGRYWVIVPVLAIAGRLASARRVPEGPGTLPTHGPLFVAVLVGTLVLVGALTFVPALALGPVVEHLRLGGM